MRFILCILFLMPFVALQAQQTDTLAKIQVLQQVDIKADHQQAEGFTFYRTNKLSTTEDILSRLPGVNLVKRGAYGMEPMLRVYSANQINLTIDGMKMYGACTDKMDPVSIYVEPNSIQTIQVNHGASGTSMGSNIGGSLNMQLKQPDFNCHHKIRGQVAQSYTSVNNGLATNFSLETAAKKFAFRLSGVYRTADNYQSPKGEIAFSGYNKYGITTGLAYQLHSKHTLRTDYVYDLGKHIGFPALTMDVGSAEAHILSLTHLYIPTKSFILSAETKLYANTIYHTMDDTRRPNVPIHMDMPGWSETAGFWHELKAGNEKHHWFWRLDGHSAYTRADMTMYVPGEKPMYMQTLPTNRINNSGSSLAYTYTKDSSYRIQANVRADFFQQEAYYTIGAQQWEIMNQDITQSRTNVLKNFSLSLNKRLTRTLRIQPMVAYGERLPSANERYGFYLYNRLDGYDYIGSPELKPETSLQGELQLRGTHQKVEWFAQYYYHHMEGYIYPYLLKNYSAMTIGARGVKSYSNIGHAIVQGIESGLQWKIHQQWLYIAAAKFAYAETNQGEPLPQIMPLKTQQALRYKHRIVQVQLEHDMALAQNRINHPSGENSTPSYQLMNLRLSKNIPIKKCILQLGLGCENMWNTLYREHLDWGGIPRPGRNWVLNITFMMY